MATNSAPSRRLQRAKSEVCHKRSSVSSLKDDFRSKFFKRLRMTRSKSVDRFRQIVENYGEDIQYRSLNDIRKALLEDKEALDLLQTDEVNDILKQIEVELAQVHLQYQAESYENETEEIVNMLITTSCRVCQANTVEHPRDICNKCSELLSSEFS